jgi:glycosyltransferase involved in cell wall biosynthesis
VNTHGGPPRSLHVITSNARRGAETFAVELVLALEALGLEARVVALTASENEQAHPAPHLGRSARSLDTLRALRWEASQVDVVVAHGSATLGACALSLVGTRTRLINRLIGELGYWVRPGRHRIAVQGLLRRPQRHVVLGERAADELARDFRVPRDRIDVIANAVPSGAFRRAEPRDREQARRRLGVGARGACLAYVGALSVEKDVGTALAAMSLVDDAHLVIAGDGPLRHSLEAQATELAPGKVSFLGVTENPAEVYAAADLLLLPSRTEGMPGVIIEAGLVGTPTLASAVGVIPEMIDDGVTGFVTSPGDPGLLAARIREALTVAAAVGSTAADVFRERYTMQQVAPLWAQTLERAWSG